MDISVGTIRTDTIISVLAAIFGLLLTLFLLHKAAKKVPPRRMYWISFATLTALTAVVCVFHYFSQ